MTNQQLRTVTLLYRLGSNKEYTYEKNGYVRVSVPWHEDKNPNVEVFKDGYYNDYSASPEWAEHGISSYGNSFDLEKALGMNMLKEWDNLSIFLSPEAEKFIQVRHLDRDGLRYGKDDGREFIAFPMYDPIDFSVVGIQRRYLDNEKPKNRMFPGSDGDSIFSYRHLIADPTMLFIMEGATDTYTLNNIDGVIIGAPSASMLKGVRDYIYSRPEITAIYLCFDDDDAGRTATKKLYDEFSGSHFVKVLYHPLGTKDLNDLATNGEPLIFDEYNEVVPRLSFIKYNDEPLMYSGYRWGIPEELAPKMKTINGYDGNIDTLYVAESMGLQTIYTRMEQDKKIFNMIIVRGL